MKGHPITPASPIQAPIFSITPEKIERLYCVLIGWVCHREQPYDLNQAEEVLRSQVDPLLYETVAHLNELLIDGGPTFIRRVAHTLGYTDVLSVFPQVTPFIHAYRDEEGDPEVLAYGFRLFTVLAAFFNEHLLQHLFTAVYSQRTHAHLHKRFQQMHQRFLPAELFWKEYDELLDTVEQYDTEVEQPIQQEVYLSPIPVALQENNQAQYYTVSVVFQLLHSIDRLYTIQFEEPAPRTYMRIEQAHTIPWEHIQDGVLVQLRLSDEDGFEYPAEYHFFSLTDMQAMYNRGSAIPTHIGRFSEIRLYPEQFMRPSLTQSTSALPNEALVSITATMAGVEIRRMSNTPTQLTVFV